MAAGAMLTQEERATYPLTGMAELQPNATPTPDTAPSDSSAVPVSPATNGECDSTPVAETPDDTPTVISRMASRAPRPEEAFVTQLKGRRLAHFELTEAIGVGGMAAVIRARDAQLDRQVALKILPPDLAADPENVRRFQQEARAAAKLHHDNIAGVFYCGEDQGLHFIAFEFVEGEDLRVIIERRGRLPVAEAVHYVLQIATGLAHSSARGVVHRDIKPSNILITSAGCAKLVDMGLARNQDCHGDQALTQSGVTLGTYDYISPEQAIEPREVDVRSDIYSLGCTFYHMITGRPPVPDGTAAKKLHHHQHVPPVDPRQHDAEIPDEVAAVLSRMMAKEPRHRYPDAEHLLRHLVPLARRLNWAPEHHAELVGMDTPLPTPPKLRPSVVAAIGATVIFGVIALYEWAAPTPKPISWPMAKAPVGPNESSVVENLTPGVLVKPPAGTQASDGERLPSPTREVATAQELIQGLGDYRVNEIVLTGDLDLGREPLSGDRHAVAGATIDRPSKHLVTIRGRSDAHRPTVHLRYHAELQKSNPEGSIDWTAFSVTSGDVVFRGIRFEINARQAPVAMTAVKAKDGARVRLQDCEMVLVNPPAATDSAGSSSIIADGGSVTASRCYFATMQDAGNRIPGTAANTTALTLIGGTAEVNNSAFSPHAVVIRIRDAGSNSRVDLDQSSCMLRNGTVFQLDTGVRAQITVERSLFSAPKLTDGNSGTLIEQTDPVFVTIRGDDNRYHNLSAFLTRTSTFGAASITAWDEFRRTIEAQGGRDAHSLVLTDSPWAEKDPLALISSRPERGFQIDVNVTDLHLADRNAAAGVEECAWGRAYVKPLPLMEAQRPTSPAGKIVDPSIQGMIGDTYGSLELAVAAAKPGDTILIKAKELRVDPMSLSKKSSTELTLRPFPGYEPLLILGDTTERDAAFFRVHDGKLRLEGLEFRLRPDRDEFTSQAVVDLVGEGQCAFKGCTITLDDTRGKPLSVVALSDSSRVMKSEPSAPQTPGLTVENCFIRGQGHLVAVRSARPLDLRVENTLVALVGSFLNVEAAAKEGMPPALIQMKLSKVTTFLTDYLVRLQALTRGKDPVVIQVNPATGCLFASADGKSLVHLEGVDVGTEQMKSLFSWEGGRQNAYSKFQPMLDQIPQADELPSLPIDQQRWKFFTGEMDAVFPFPPVKFAEQPEIPLSRSLVRTMPNHFRVTSDSMLAAYGVDVDTLPRPHPGIEIGPRPIR